MVDPLPKALLVTSHFANDLQYVKLKTKGAYQPIDLPEFAREISAGEYRWSMTRSLCIIFERPSNCRLWAQSNPIYLEIFLELHAVVLNGIKVESQPSDWYPPFTTVPKDDLEGSQD